MRILPYNLLPDESRRAFQKEYRGRLAYLLCLIGIAFFVGSAFLLAPTIYMAYESEAALVREVSSNEQEAARISANQLTVEVKRTNEMLKLLATTHGYPSSELLREIAERRTAGILISSIKIGSVSTGEISVSGLAATREELLAFRRSFERSVPFSAAEIPVNAFARSRHLPFIMRIQVAT